MYYGAKNHGAIMSDADKNLHEMLGHHLVHLPVTIFVGESQQWIGMVVTGQGLNVNAGHEKDTDVGPINTLERIEDVIQSAQDEGSKILLDGHGVKLIKYPNGNFVRPTVITDVTTYEML